jgi:putative phosphoesterase
MRIGFIADLHANAAALSAITDVLDTCDRVVCLGDFVGYYCQVNEVIDLVRKYDPLCILGNHDDFVLHGCPSDFPDSVRFGIEFADRVITPTNRAWLADMPQVWGGKIGGLPCLLFHGSPWKPMEDYLYADSPLLADLDHFEFDILAFGQTHRPLIRLEKRPVLINPGSVGQSRDAKLLGKACALVFDTETMQPELVARTYDMEAVVDEAVHNGADAWAHKFLPQPATE